MPKGMFAKEALVGDIVQLSAVERPHTVTVVHHDGTVPCIAINGVGWVADVAPEDPVILLHRPWPEGKNGAQMLHELAEAAAYFSRKGMGRIQLQDAMEAYELGLPEEKS